MDTAIQEVLGTGLVNPADVAQALGTTLRSVQRWQAGSAAPRREALDRLLELKAVLDLARQVMPPETAALWLRGPVPVLDYEKPLELIRAGEFRRVIGALAALGEGVPD